MENPASQLQTAVSLLLYKSLLGICFHGKELMLEGLIPALLARVLETWCFQSLRMS